MPWSCCEQERPLPGLLSPPEPSETGPPCTMQGWALCQGRGWRAQETEDTRQSPCLIGQRLDSEGEGLREGARISVWTPGRGPQCSPSGPLAVDLQEGVHTGARLL